MFLHNMKVEITSLIITLVGAVCGFVFGSPILIIATVMVGILLVLQRSSFDTIADGCLFVTGMWVAYIRQPKPDGRFYQVLHRLEHAAETRVDHVMALPPEQQLGLIGIVLGTGLVGLYGIRMLVRKNV